MINLLNPILHEVFVVQNKAKVFKVNCLKCVQIKKSQESNSTDGILNSGKAQRKEIKFGNHGIKTLHDSKKSLVKCHRDLKADNKYTEEQTC